MKPVADISAQLVQAARRLRTAMGPLTFAPPVTHVYNPLDYAWAPHELYLRKFGATPKRVVFLGMNPGPFGMVQTGVPFGEVAAVRDWLKIQAPLGKRPLEHPRRPLSGFECSRSEVSGRRLWGLFASVYPEAEGFFREHLVVNYCPLAFIEETGRNRTPDKLPRKEREALFAACNAHLLAVVRAVQPEWIIAVGDFALKRAQEAFPEGGPKLGRILHPSPASPAANRAWAALATKQLQELGIWPKLL